MGSRNVNGKHDAADAVIRIALDLSKDLHEILETLNKEFESQGPVAKTLAKADFRKKLGVGIEEWIVKSAELVNTLSELQHTNDESRIEGLTSTISDLEKLQDYFAALSEIVKKFVKDPETLSEGLVSIARRKGVVSLLLVALKQLD